jgi:sporulation protein YlmC with PRC-barrel domain
MSLEELRLGASVLSRDGHKLGQLSRFVVNKQTYALTHIVIDTGLWRSGDWKNGWGLSHDRVVPLGVLDRASSDEVHLTMTGDEFKDLSVDYIDEGFAPIQDWEPGRLDPSDIARFTASIPGEPGPWFFYETEARAPDEVDIPRDAPVWRVRPHEKIGEVERVLVDGVTSRVSELVVRRGFLFSKEMRLPVRYVTEVIGDGIVRVDIDDAALAALAEFHEEG